MKNKLYTLRQTLSLKVLLMCILTIMTIGVDVSGQTQTFSKTFGGSDQEEGFDITTLSNGEAAMIGYTREAIFEELPGASLLSIARINRNGTLLWNNIFPVATDEWNYDIKETSDGSIIWVANFGFHEETNWNILIGKCTSTGVVSWIRQISTFRDERATAIIETSDGDYAITGYVEGDPATVQREIFVCKVRAADGVTLWTYTYGTDHNEDANDIKELPNGSLVVVGGGEPGNPFNTTYPYAMLVSANGTWGWSRYYGIIPDALSGFRSVSVPYNGANEFVACGESCPNGIQRSDIVAVKADANGARITPVYYYDVNGDNIGHNGGYGITYFGGYYFLTGYTEDMPGGNKDLFVMGLNNNLGAPRWLYTHGGEGMERGHDIDFFFRPHPTLQFVNEQGYWVIGHTTSYGAGSHDWYLLSTHGFGLIPGDCSEKVMASANPMNSDMSVTFTRDQYAETQHIDLAPCCEMSGSIVCNFVDILKPSVQQQASNQSMTEELTMVNITIAPNPASPGHSTTFLVEVSQDFQSRIEITDMNGRIIHNASQRLAQGENAIDFSTKGLATGVYHIRIAAPDDDDALWSAQFIVE